MEIEEEDDDEEIIFLLLSGEGFRRWVFFLERESRERKIRNRKRK